VHCASLTKRFGTMQTSSAGSPVPSTGHGCKHHSAVAALGDEVQDRWLRSRRLESLGSLPALRGHLREAQTRSDADSCRTVRFQVRRDVQQNWRDSAARSGASFQDRIIRA
jgi:hypothetical protein